MFKIKKLGINYSNQRTIFRVLAPTVSDVKLLIYSDSLAVARTKHKMIRDEEGVYQLTLEGDLKGMFYTFLVDDKNEVTDPYSIATSLNGIRSAIIDLEETNPEGFKDHQVPFRENLCNSIIYEVHIKDFTVHKTSGVKHKGKYLGFCEEGTTYNGLSTGIDHLKELGITHVHLMPVYDFVTVNEAAEHFYDDDNYNWGYDPEHYNVPEGSYSLKPDSPTERIKELKTLIQSLHEAGISVVLDAVYNHTYRSDTSNFNVLYPDYYYRLLDDGNFSDGAGCGNELATEKTHVKEFIKESLLYWLKEYKVDGFRFDLMGLMDVQTAEEIVKELKQFKEDILIYGEPWTGGSTVLPYSKLSLKGSQYKKGFGFFNDTFRDAIKGNNDGYDKGFVQGNIYAKNAVETGLVGSIAYDDNHIGFAASANETVNYANSHDNLILYDKIKKASVTEDEKQWIRQNKLALSIVILSQGISFIHAGNEFMRSKDMVANSYKSPTSLNAIDWSLKEKNILTFNFVKDLIELKKSYPVFSLCQSEEIREKIRFMDTNTQANLIAYTLELEKEKKYFIAIFNGNSEEQLIFSANIKKHLSYQIKREVEDITLKKVLGMNGFIKKETSRWNKYGIITTRRAVAIWEITINKFNETL